MTFGEFVKDRPKGTRPKTNWLKIVPGVPTVLRILDEQPTELYKHWFVDGSGRRIGVRCLGPDTCPVCQRNAQLGFNRDHPDFIPSRWRFQVNVVDLTPVKRCPVCAAAYAEATAPNVCTVDGCTGTFADGPAEPLDEVKILERGRRLLDQFKALAKAPHPMAGERLPVQDYPIMLIATGKGTDMVITAIPQMVQEITHDYDGFELPSGLVFTPEEITYLLEGGNFSDVLEERKATREMASDTTEVTKERIPF